MTALFSSKSAHHQEDLFKTHHLKTSRYIRVLFYKEPGYTWLLFGEGLEQLQDMTLQLLVPNSKRLGGYTQWVHFFLQKSTRHQEDFFKTDHFKTSRYIRILFNKEPGCILRNPSAKTQSNSKTWPSSYLFQIARGSRATPSWMCFFLQKGTHHSKIPRSATWFYSRKHSDDACFYSARPKGTRRGF